MENLLKQLEDLRQKVIEAKEILDIEALKTEKRELENKMKKPDFWSNNEEAVKVSKQAESLDEEVGKWEGIEKEIEDLEKFVAVANKEGDDSVYKDSLNAYHNLEKKFEKLEFMLLFSQKYDKHNAIVSIHAGTGGVDAQDFAQMLARMYMRFSEKKNLKVELIENNPGQEAGIKSQVFRVEGRWAYAFLKSENGVHRLVRISPFDAESMRHTSFVKVEVIPELAQDQDIEIKDEDLRIDVFRSSGPGGQSVNTTDSAVRIVHLPTKISVASQTERSQHQNREIALQLLKSKLHKLQEEEREKKEEKLKGKVKQAVWGKQIRSYVLQPYRMVKDHRTNHSTDQVDEVLDGNLEEFIESYLRWRKNNESK
ncbi:MAG: peptide chain release factor 2 [Parcubacteria group bacterium]